MFNVFVVMLCGWCVLLLFCCVVVDVLLLFNVLCCCVVRLVCSSCVRLFNVLVFV